MKCSSHPNIEAVASCASCDVPLCENCANEDGNSGYLCSRCVAVSAVAEFGEDSDHLQQQTELREAEGGAGQLKSRKAQYGIIIVCLLIIATQIPNVFFETGANDATTPLVVTQEVDYTGHCLGFLYEAAALSEAGDLVVTRSVIEENCVSPPFTVSETATKFVIASPSAVIYRFSEIHVDREDLTPEILD